MPIRKPLATLLFASLLLSPNLGAQEAGPKPAPADPTIHLDVVVTPKSGQPVAGLQQQDFTLLDNKVPRPIKSFRALTAAQAPTEIILLIDSVNAAYPTVASARGQIDNFLLANGGHLAHPTTLAIFTDTGTQIQQGYSTDGKALAADLDRFTIGLRDIRRSTGIYGAEERFQLSLTTLAQLASREATRPGHKLILWISPGWPILSGPGIDLSTHQQQKLFGNIVNVSTELRRANVTLYAVNPLGATEGLGQVFYYQTFLKGVAKPGQVEIGDLSLQVLATQSGGLVLNSNDVADMLQRCVADTTAFYELSFDPAPTERPDDYRTIDIKLANPSLTARTRTGYYAQP